MGSRSGFERAGFRPGLLAFLGGVLLVCMGAAGTDSGALEGWAADAPGLVRGLPGDTLLPDTIIRDTLRPVLVRPDSLLPDSILARLAPETDTVVGPEADIEEVRQLLPRNVPEARGGGPAIPENGLWRFDREGLLATHAMTLHDLLSLVPGLTMLRGGDHGNPVAVTALGLGGGQVRVFRDGVEDAPMEGGVLDLAQVGLAGLESVAVERRGAELRIHLESLRITDGRPYTYLDVSTGDLQTNTLRATFAHPNAFGGTLLVALDRLDTEGPFREERGATYGTNVRYALFPRDGLGVALQYRSRTAQRPEGFFTPVEVNRSDLGIRAGLELGESVVLEGFGNRTTVEPGTDAEVGADTLLPADARSLLGVRGSGAWRGLWGRTEARAQAGEGWPSSVLALEVGGSVPGLGGASVAVEREGWDGGEAGRSLSGRVWSEPRGGVSVFADAQDSRRGVPFFVPPVLPEEENGNGNGNGNGEEDPDEDEEPPPSAAELLRFGERQGVRAGARGRWGGLDVSGALLRIEADSLFPMGLPFDRDGVTGTGGARTGVELQARIPLRPVLRGLSVSGHAQFWEQGPAWRYLPDRNYVGEVNWHHLGYDDNLEIWFDVGVRGRDAMALPLLSPDDVIEIAPSSLSWFGRLQFRVVTVRIFVHWENFTLRSDLQDFPNRTLPATRAIYGIRWSMWN